MNITGRLKQPVIIPIPGYPPCGNGEKFSHTWL